VQGHPVGPAYMHRQDNYLYRMKCTKWRTNFSSATLSALPFSSHTQCKLMPCSNLTLCSHLWKYAYSCYSFSSWRKICACVIIMLPEIGTPNPMQCGPLHNILTQLTTFFSFNILGITTFFLLSLPVKNCRISFASWHHTILMTQNPMTWLEQRLTWCFWLKSRHWHSDSIFMEGEVADYNCCNTICDEVAKAPHMIHMSLW
jgi:hypothetical protein